MDTRRWSVLAAGAALAVWAALPATAEQLPLRTYDIEHGLASNRVMAIHRDAHGFLWIATRQGMSRFDGSGLVNVGPDQGLTAPVITDVGETRDGQLWIATSGGIARLEGERFQLFGVADGVPAGLIRRLYLDRRGRLWAGTNRGQLARADAPASARPTFQSLAPPDLTGADIYSFTEDEEGRLYVGTSRGVLRLDPETGGTRFFGASDGLAAGDVLAAWRDRTGALWFGGPDGLSRLALEKPSRPPAPPAYIGARRGRGAVAGGSARTA